jgi:hypothetical protein
MAVPRRSGRCGRRRGRWRGRWSRGGGCGPRRRCSRLCRRGRRRPGGRCRSPRCRHALGGGGRHVSGGGVILSSASRKANEQHHRRKGEHPPQSRTDGSAGLSATSHEHAKTPACSICSTPRAPRMSAATPSGQQRSPGPPERPENRTSTATDSADEQAPRCRARSSGA